MVVFFLSVSPCAFDRGPHCLLTQIPARPPPSQRYCAHNSSSISKRYLSHEAVAEAFKVRTAWARLVSCSEVSRCGKSIPVDSYELLTLDGTRSPTGAAIPLLRR